jgi:tetratricopeptide (TPR) repeat protein
MSDDAFAQALGDALRAAHSALAADPPTRPEPSTLRFLTLPLWILARSEETMACGRLLEQQGEAGPIELLLRGFWALHRGDVPTARASFATALELDPDAEFGQVGMGYAHFYAQEYDKAAESFAGVTGPSSGTAATMERAARQFAAGAPPDGVHITLPPLPNMASELVTVLQLRRLEGPARAMAAAEQILQAGQELPMGVRGALLRLLIELQLETPSSIAARDTIELALRDFDGDGVIWWLAGINARRLGKVELSEQLFDVATRGAPLLGRAWAARGASLIELDRWEEAQRCYATAVLVDDTVGSAWAELAACQVRREEWAEAVHSLDRAIALGEDSYENRANRASCRLSMGDVVGALEELEGLVDRFPDHPKVAEAHGLIDELASHGNQYVIGDDLDVRG